MKSKTTMKVIIKQACQRLEKEVKMHTPKSIEQTAALAKVEECKWWALRAINDREVG